MLNKKDKSFLICMLFFAVLSFFVYFEGRMNVQNTTAYLFSYKYGFIPRGLIGTVINFACDLVGIPLTYNVMLLISMMATILLFVLLFVLFYVVLKRTTSTRLIYYVLAFLAIICFPMFLTWNNFGRLDEYLIILTLASVILLITEKAEWLVVIFCLAACFVHVGFVFTNAGVILAILLYKAINNRDKRGKYITLLMAVFIVCAAVFIITELLTGPISTDDYNYIVDKAKVIAEQGGNTANFNDAYSLLDSELLKQDVYTNENVWRIKNWVEAPIFFILFLPYIIVGIKVFVDTIRRQSKALDKLKYLALLLGCLTIVPELILKVDYGRWVYNILLYYVIITAFMLVQNNNTFNEVLRERLKITVSRVVFPQAYIIYPIFFVPFRDVYISDLTTKLMDVVGRLFRIW